VQGVEKELERRQPLLSVYDGAFLHQPRLLLDLLQDYGAEEVRLMLLVGSC